MFSKAIFLSTRRSLLSFPRLFPCLAIHTYVTPDECILKKDEVYMFTDTGFWDTFRCLLPFINLVYPSVAAQMQEGFLNSYL